MNTRTSFLQQLKHTPNIPVCFASVSRYVVALRAMEIPPLLYSLLRVSFKVKVKVTLRLAVYRQSIHLGVKPLETHDQIFFN
jgi:hypothetical protein